MKIVSKIVALGGLLASVSAFAAGGSGSLNVPEPGSLSLIGLALAGVVATRFFKKK